MRDLARDFYSWLCALRRRHVRALVAHPHHYISAAILTGLAYGLGHMEAAFIVLTWSYAVLENLTNLGD